MIHHDAIFITGAISFTAYQFTSTHKVLCSCTVHCIRRARALARKTSMLENIYFKPKQTRNVQILPSRTILFSSPYLPTNFVKSAPLSYRFFILLVQHIIYAPTFRAESFFGTPYVSVTASSEIVVFWYLLVSFLVLAAILF